MIYVTIDNRRYNLSKYAPFHPGGVEILNRMSTTKDAQAFVESVHSAKSLVLVYKTLSSCPSEPIEGVNYDFTLYHQLKSEVETIIPKSQSKATSIYFMRLSIIIILNLFLLYKASENIIYAFLGGMLTLMLGFNVLHDGSHYGIFKSPKANEITSWIANAWLLWNAYIWNNHHVDRHHSYTGNVDLDPDTDYFGYAGLRYSNKDKHKNKEWSVPISSLLVPGMWLGQTLFYRVVLNNKLHFRQISHRNLFKHTPWYHYITILTKLYIMYMMGWNVIIYIISLNFFYAINIIGDHDMLKTHDHFYDGPCWLKCQIQNSGNFAPTSWLVTHAFGGINLQIEHHLFPTYSHVHYPLIRLIVIDFCKRHNIPHVEASSMWSMFVDYLSMLKHYNSE